MRQLARDTWAEAKKVNWPDKETTRNLTIVVIAISIVLGLFLGGIDYALLKLLEAL
ncbi:MAG: preprotein translocase subunit SecE [Chloroflexota bacterium]